MNLSGRKILVTGGAGFLGSQISQGLAEAGAEVRILDPMLSGRKENIEALAKDITVIQGDILDENTLAEAAKGIDTIVHTAFPTAICDRDLERQYIDIGTIGTFNVLKRALANRALFVYASSISVYGEQKYTPIDEEHPLEPILIYGATKLTGEYYTRVMAKSYGLKTVILRYTDVYGPRNGRYSAPIQFMHLALAGKPIVIRGSGKQARSYMYIKDIVDATTLAVATPEAIGETINISGDQCVSVLELAEQIKELVGNDIEIQYNQNQQEDLRCYAIDNTKAKKILGFSPQWNLDRGLAETLKWVKTKTPEFFKRP